MTDAERFDALMNLVDPARSANPSRGRELAVFGLAEPGPKGGYRPTNAGWVVIGDQGRAFQPRHP
ncbi:hypothetical protein [Brevundimonas sp.]|uniref:hypothetical protein n=1 Tax=Brevundimonas sp. TaxID=1871086 RepID=UPI001A329D8A|nr:hypothetical protein [Brevundimonas sp.]MBJ7483511.1 hypothetical protein [Brevundimonas sp.]